MKFPWPHLYEHPHNIVTLNIERKLPSEDIVLYCLIRSPENRSIAEMDEIVRHHKEDPIETLRSYQRTIGMARVPSPIRQWLWWASLNAIGRRRCHNFGTFGISSIGAQGAGIVRLTPVLTTTLHFGMFDEHHGLDVRLSWDHRVLDGATVGRVLTDLEQVLNRDIVRELTGTRRAAA
jgi:hypothetical protein